MRILLVEDDMPLATALQKSLQIQGFVVNHVNQGKLALNAFIIYEWGNTIASEFETEFRLKYRYRYIEQFQPAIELYSGENYLGIGSAFMGLQRFSAKKQLKWEVGFITGVDSRSNGHIFRVAVEYEFLALKD